MNFFPEGQEKTRLGKVYGHDDNFLLTEKTPNLEG